jgi:small subunit ribosomal protein S16
MVSIRLTRVGKKNQPIYRLIAVEKTKDPWGRHLEILGFYNPRVSAEIQNLKEERLKYWLSCGAQLTPTVHNLLVNQGVIQGPKVKKVKHKKQKEVKEEATEKETAEK